MLISRYLVFKNNYVVPNFNYGMLCYVTISTSSLYVSMTRLMEKNKDEDDDDLVSKLRKSGVSLIRLDDVHKENSVLLLLPKSL